MQINQIFIHAYRLSQMSIIRSVHWLKNSVQLSENPQCFFDLPNLVAFEQFIWKSDNLKPRTLGKTTLQRTSEDYFSAVFFR